MWTKWGYFWRRSGNGIYDLVYNTLTKIIMDGDTSTWAHCSFCSCAIMLQSRKRYPKALLREGTVKTRYGYFIKRLFGVEPLFRSRYTMSRDPWIVLGACYGHLMEFANEAQAQELTEIYERTTIPWYLYRHYTWIWRKRLIKDNSKFYVKRLRYLRALATVKHFERNYKLWES